jgi:hypothetical protein
VISSTGQVTHLCFVVCDGLKCVVVCGSMTWDEPQHPVRTRGYGVGVHAEYLGDRPKQKKTAWASLCIFGVWLETAAATEFL